MSTAASTRDHVAALRSAHDRLARLVEDLDDEALRGASYDPEWTVTDVLAHLGSQTEMIEQVLAASLEGGVGPGAADLEPLAESWERKGAAQARDDCLAVGEAFLRRLERLGPIADGSLRVDLFGQHLDLEGVVRMRLTETAVHAWDVEVVGDPRAALDGPAVPLLLDHLEERVDELSSGEGGPYRVRVGTHDPVRDLVVEVDGPALLRDAEPDDSYDGSIDLPAEAFVRLVLGRLDVDHTPEHSASGLRGLADLRLAFPGV